MSPRPRVFELVFGNTLGGAEVLLREMLRVADKERFEWHLGLMRRKAPWEEFTRLRGTVDFALHNVPCGRGFDPRCLWRLRNLLRRERIDVVHTHLFRADLHGRWAARWAGVPVVVSTVHNFEWFREYRVMNLVERWSARSADHVIGCTESVTAHVQEVLHLPPGKAITVPNGTPLGPFLEQRDPAPLRREFGLAEDEKVVGTIGRLSEQKHHTDFLAMAKRVVDRFPRTRFLLIGDGPLRPDLERQRRELGLDDRVLFTGPRGDIPLLLALMDCFVLSSLWEGLPVTLLEAMAAATPCVSTDVGGCRDVVRPGETGWLVPERNPDALARAVIGVLEDPPRAEAVAARARQLVTERHSIERFTRDHESLYLRLLGRGRGGSTGQ
jgi:glycosyltransferase involved in cell wall biosynthesis